jgi:hypothetical protein
VWRRSPDTDVDAEVRFHLDARIEDLIASGRAPEQARAQALEEFGDVDDTRPPGIGATTAVLSVVNPVLFAPMPFPHGDRVDPVETLRAD